MEKAVDDWSDPVENFHRVARHFPACVFLHSSLATPYSGRYSLLAWDEAERREGEDFSSLEDIRPGGLWFGWFGYPLRHALEELPRSAPASITVPALRFSRFAQVLRFDHAEKRVEVLAGDGVLPPPVTAFPETISVTSLSSSMTKAEYLDIVEKTLEQIRLGNFYQANITRKFTGDLTCRDAAQLFISLCRSSPAPYSAFLQWPDVTMLSSSPELFLRAESSGKLTTRPIKGTLARQEKAELLQQAPKDRAENLMIVDLMRNDLSRVCLPGSVEAGRLFEVDSFATLHHLSSEITGQLAEGKTVLDAVKACFPPGSMTGAPKIAAMRWCGLQEKLERGIYSGALGWLGAEGAELSVVIRTLLLQDGRFEFQVGGGIVADSVPLQEWQETLTKASGIAQALGIPQKRLAEL